MSVGAPKDAIADIGQEMIGLSGAFQSSHVVITLRGGMSYNLHARPLSLCSEQLTKRIHKSNTFSIKSNDAAAFEVFIDFAYLGRHVSRNAANTWRAPEINNLLDILLDMRVALLAGELGVEKLQVMSLKRIGSPAALTPAVQSIVENRNICYADRGYLLDGLLMALPHIYDSSDDDLESSSERGQVVQALRNAFTFFCIPMLSLVWISDSFESFFETYPYFVRDIILTRMKLECSSSTGE